MGCFTPSGNIMSNLHAVFIA